MKNYLLLFAFCGFLFTSLNAQQDYQLSQGFFEGEPYLAINPTNPQNIVVAWMRITPTDRMIRTKATFNGGQSWNAAVDVPKIYSQAADPTLAFDNSGILFLCYINHSGGSPDTGGVYSVKSTDGGLSWSNLIEAININADGPHQPVDRPWLVCDRSSGPYQGILYLTTKNVSGTPSPYRPYFLKSTDGAQTWSNWRYVDSTGWLSAVPSAMAVPSVDANGVFHGIYVSYLATQNALPQYIMASSTNAGSSFQYSQVLSSLPSSSNDSAKLAWQMIADPSDANHLALLFPMGTNGDLDIFMTETTNSGASWSPKLRINDDAISNGKLQDLVWASFDNDGDLVVCWRDRRNGAATGYAQSSEIMAAVRWKDSSNFESNFVISDQLVPYNNILAEAGNDFLSQQMMNDTLYIAWGDTRTGFLNIWFDKIALINGSTNGLINLASEEIPFVQVFPNPSSNIVNIELGEEKLLDIKVYNAESKLMLTVLESQFSISELPDGIYFVVVQTENKTSVNRMIKK